MGDDRLSHNFRIKGNLHGQGIHARWKFPGRLRYKAEDTSQFPPSHRNAFGLDSSPVGTGSGMLGKALTVSAILKENCQEFSPCRH